MKKIICLMMVVGLVTACAKDDYAGDMPAGKGTVSFAVAQQGVVSARVQAAGDGIDLTTLGIDLPTSGDELTLKFNSVDGEYSFTGTVGQYNKDAKRTYLEQGLYSAEVMWGNAETEGTNAAHFYGQTGVQITPRTHSSENITATLSKALVRIDFTDEFKGYFANGAEIKLATSSNPDAEFVVTYDNGNAGKPYFVLAGDAKSFTISGKATKQHPATHIQATPIEFTPISRNDVVAHKLYTYVFDVNNANSVSVKVTITNEPIEEITVATIEMNDDALMD